MRPTDDDPYEPDDESNGRWRRMPARVEFAQKTSVDPNSPRGVFRTTILVAAASSAVTVLSGDLIGWIKDLVVFLWHHVHISIGWMP
jgi:hypothetical protein